MSISPLNLLLRLKDAAERPEGFLPHDDFAGLMWVLRSFRDAGIPIPMGVIFIFVFLIPVLAVCEAWDWSGGVQW